jgi:hypothetical protein
MAYERIVPNIGRGSFLLALLTVVAGCSGKTEPTLGPGEDPASGESADYACVLGDCETIGRRAADLTSPFCPVAEPTTGSPCTKDGQQCSYGDAPSAYCRRFLECVESVWRVPSVPRTACQAQPDGFCPSAPDPGGACTTNAVDYNVPCSYDSGVYCYCLGNPLRRPGIAGVWECYGPPRNGRCPEVLPNLGDGCARSGQYCKYGIVEWGCFAPYANVYCERGAWRLAGEACLL